MMFGIEELRSELRKEVIALQTRVMWLYDRQGRTNDLLERIVTNLEGIRAQNELAFRQREEISRDLCDMNCNSEESLELARNLAEKSEGTLSEAVEGLDLLKNLINDDTKRGKK